MQSKMMVIVGKNQIHHVKDAKFHGVAYDITQHHICYKWPAEHVTLNDPFEMMHILCQHDQKTQNNSDFDHASLY